MINISEVVETNEMITKENLDVRTITMGISLLDCISSNLDELNRNIYEKITKLAKHLVPVGKEIEQAFGIPVVSFTNVNGYKATVCEEKSIAVAAAKLTAAFANATVAKVNVVSATAMLFSSHTVAL